MDICEDILEQRDCGHVRCEIRSIARGSPPEIAQAFGLLGDAGCYREVTRETARAILIRVLHMDLAYDAVVVPAATAEDLADRFLTAASSGDTRYFSNGDFSRARPIEWTPATSATFDTGVLVLSSDRSGCLWVEDED